MNAEKIIIYVLAIPAIIAFLGVAIMIGAGILGSGINISGEKAKAKFDITKIILYLIVTFIIGFLVLKVGSRIITAIFY